VIPVVAGIGATIALVVLVWVAGPARLGLRRARDLRRASRKLDQTRRPADQRPVEPRRDEREAAVLRDAERALERAREEARAMLADAEAKAQAIVAKAGDTRAVDLAAVRAEASRSAEEIVQEAKGRAQVIIGEAEAKRQELLSAAEQQLAAAEQHAERERAIAEETRRRMTALLRDLLAQARGESEAANVYPLDGAQEARAKPPK